MTIFVIFGKSFFKAFLINGIGTHKELLENNDIYREVYQSQTQKGGE